MGLRPPPYYKLRGPSIGLGDYARWLQERERPDRDPDGFTVGRTGELVPWDVCPSIPSLRRPITAFSRSSRRRFVRKFATIDERGLKPPLFVTLTLDGWANGVEPREAKRWLATLWKRIVRRWPRAWCAWKLEPQRRGAPHFHLLLYGVDFLDAQIWSRVWASIHGGGQAAAMCSVDVDQVRSLNDVRRYAAKYVSKAVVPRGWKSPGRWWGFLGRESVPWAKRVEIEVSREDYDRVRRLIVHRLLRKEGRYVLHHAFHSGRTMSCVVGAPLDTASAMIERLHMRREVAMPTTVGWQWKPYRLTPKGVQALRARGDAIIAKHRAWRETGG
jgi:hypothetical protein